MFKVKIITQGKLKEAWLTQSLKEYQKRLKNRMQIDWVLFETAKELEEEAMKEPMLIALDSSGKNLSSKELSKELFTKWGSRPCFIIGGANGLSKSVIQKANFCWSLSNLTFTHQMVRIILIEQLYRALEIEQGTSYHK